MNEIQLPFLNFSIIFLWSDVCILLLLTFSVVWFLRIRKNEFWKKAFQKISGNRMAMISLCILSVYVCVAVLDSIHFRVSSQKRIGEVESILDIILTKAKNNPEKTYSSPFAIFSHSKESVTTQDGKIVRGYPRLKNAGVHLKSTEERNLDILWRSLSAVFLFCLIMGMILGVAIFYFRKKKGITNWREICSHIWRHFYRGHRSWVVIPLSLFILLFSFIFQFYGEYHIFGTDKAGFDVFYTSVKSIRTGILIGTLTTLVVTPIAIMAGILSGYLGGWMDDLVQYLYTTLESIPSILLIAAAMLIAETFTLSESSLERADRKLLYLCVIMGITSWTNLCRLIRAETLKVRELEYIEAAKSFGASQIKIMLRHILPNVAHIVFIVIVLRFSGLVLAEAVLSYVGIGVDPTIQSWGNMINQARFELAREPVIWWNLISAFLFMFVLVLPANILADAVRDALDPKLKRI